MRLSIKFIGFLLILILLACELTNFSSNNSELTIRIITKEQNSIVAEKIILKNNSDDTQIFTSKIISNEIVFKKLEHGSYSLFDNTQLLERNIKVYTKNVFHDFTLDPDKHEYRSIVIQNNCFRNIVVATITSTTFEDINSVSEVIYSPSLSREKDNNLVVLGNYPIKRARFKGFGGYYSIPDIDKKELVIISDSDRPWMMITFCKETIASTIGEIKLFYNDEGFAQIGIESFDKIARDYMIVDLIGSGLVFGIITRKEIAGIIESLENDDSVLKLELIFYPN